MSQKDKPESTIHSSTEDLVEALQKLNKSISALSLSLNQAKSEFLSSELLSIEEEEASLEYDMELIEQIYPPVTVH